MWAENVFSVYFVNDIELAGTRSGGTDAVSAGAGCGGTSRRPPLATGPARIVVSTASTELHARLSFEPAGSRIMFQCLTNSIGGLGRSIVFNNLRCITDRIFSVSVTQCVRKKLCRRF